ncbi:MAG: hypothetical protein B6245_09005 [Desulfobacteraceae bacterium 4572_88]|nr:MAG: hypothetical protein B6245_09005 [Desulfobacteraceae bacterium 4572_88]
MYFWKSSRVEVSSPAPSQLDPLAPGHTGFTTNPQPCLLFYISDPWPYEIEFVLDKTEGQEAESVYETRIIGIEEEGIYPTDLVKAG